MRPTQPVLVQSRYAVFGKRALDLSLVIISLPLVVPVVTGLAVAVSLGGGKPFFTQRRVGRDGREFNCLKLRTMRPDAEARLRELLTRDANAAIEWGRKRKLSDDPRVTRLGRILRKLSLDELPQLWNVFRGEMSLVGPRPVVPDELVRYGEFDAIYKAVRPGLTGAWQVSGRNEVSYRQRVMLDVNYVREVSLLTDLAIIARTVVVVVKKTGL